MSEYLHTEDGWRDQVKPAYVNVEADYFFPDSLNVELIFELEKGHENPKAKIPLLFCAEHMIAEFENGRKSGEHKATEQEQRDAFALLGRIFPAWTEFCKGAHTTEDKLYWFERDGRESVKSTAMDIKVWHSGSGYCNATVKDPANIKDRKPRERTTKAAAITRANAAFTALFGNAAEPAAKITSEDEMPF